MRSSLLRLDLASRLGVAAAVVAASLFGSARLAAAGSSHGRAVDAALFEPGSCVSFEPPTGRARGTVFIDAGHGGPDPGAVGTTADGRTVAEASLTVPVALDALPLMRRDGFRVVLSRTGPSAVARPLAGDLAGGVFTAQGDHRDLVARDVCADRSHANVLIGVYFNAGAARSAVGALTLYDAVRPFRSANLRLATLLQRAVLASLRASGAPVPDDGVHTDVGFGSAVTGADRAYGHLLILGPAKAGYLATPSAMPGALIEPLFLTDPAEASLAASDRGQHALARGLADAVRRFFGTAA